MFRWKPFVKFLLTRDGKSNNRKPLKSTVTLQRIVKRDIVDADNPENAVDADAFQFFQQRFSYSDLHSETPAQSH